MHDDTSPNFTRNGSARLQAFLVALMSTLLLLLLLEGVLQIMEPDEPHRLDGRPKGDTRRLFCRYHPILGYEGAPGRTGNECGQFVKLDDAGNHDAKGSRRRDDPLHISLLGDSFFWGYCVSDDEMVSSRLQGLFDEQATRREAPSVKVTNHAVSGYGTDQQFLQYLLKVEDDDPDVVVIGFFAENDFFENGAARYHNCPKPIFRISGDALCLSNVPVPRLTGWEEDRVLHPQRIPDLLSWSALVRRLASRSWRVGLAERNTTGRMPDPAIIPPCPDSLNVPTCDQPYCVEVDTDHMVEHTRRILFAFASQVLSRGRRFLVFFIPETPHRTDRAQQGVWAAALREACTAEGIDFIDGDAAMDRAVHPGRLYDPETDHWSPEGHRWAAELLYERISKLLRDQHS